ncbi:hypothetical protein GGTG_03836 [Gaeumannomyces tritici R3-111a-1]|uniref:Apple domain-containing protein n=1 Tax=Gaeumannomyces tritici (strain R3-111a-1) TaxID=644352 RepID=J3NRD2_GAET3|nr:hypothetical protein GGTG_03836 [Gaeumannomyces tritici R3-111a-1]EJT78738.1 hypothetical protein GGTG_03836 [Gaeumannomyces tritici R3-111a-1]
MPWLPIESSYPPRHPVESTLAGEQRRHKVCGMSIATFVLAVALFVAVIGAAVGGGVGGSMAASTSRSLEECRSALNRQSSPSTPISSTPPSPPSSTGAPDGNCTANKRVLEIGPNGGVVPPTRDVVVELGCPAMQSAQKILTIDGKRLTFAIRCGEDFNRKDIGAAISYSMDDCLYSCASYNVISGRQECVAVTFSAELSGSVAARGANCWLKNETATPRRNLGNKIATGRLETIGT